MDGKTSFIPRGQMTTSFESNKKSSKISLFLLVSIIIFIVSLVLAGGVFLLSEYKTKAIKNKIDSLERARGSFEPALIEQLSNLDTRINSAKRVLDNHISVSSFFRLLERIALKSVRFNEFEFTQRENSSFYVTMKGEADSYSSVALQSDMFAESKYIQEPIFSGFRLNSKGNVLFDFSTVIDKSLILYENNIEN